MKVLIFILFAFNLSAARLSRLADVELDSNRPLRVGYYIGTFNPPHLFHRYFIKQTRKVLDLDYVVVIPSELPVGKPATYYVDRRLEMLHLTFRKSNKIFVPIDKEHNYFRLLSRSQNFIEGLHPEVEHYGIIGTDSGEAMIKLTMKYMSSLKNWYGVEHEGSQIDLFEIPQGRELNIVQIEGENKIHSTQIRQFFQANPNKQHPGKDILPLSNKVYSYIIKNKMYQRENKFAKKSYRCLLHLLRMASAFRK